MRIVVGITGGIAAYKAVSLVRSLVKAGHDVKVIPTQNALRFVGSTTLEAISRNTVDPDLYTDVEQVKHVSLGQDAELIIVAPATAAFISRLATGAADDLLMNTILASKAPVYIAPAMHSEMWENKATAANVNTLMDRGVHIIGPASGPLTGEDSGVGRMSEPDEIIRAIFTRNLDLVGKTVIVTAGGTREPIDAVRFIGNHSSGKQGLAIAKEAKARGASVILIAANVSESIPAGISCIPVETVSQLDAAMQDSLPGADILVMSAAVSDYRLNEPNAGKIKKESNGQLHLTLDQTDDLLLKATTWQHRNRPSAISVGFAAESESEPSKLQELGQAKLQAKGCDYLVANNIEAGSIFGSDYTAALILSKNGQVEPVAGTKTELASRLLDVIVSGFN